MMIKKMQDYIISFGVPAFEVKGYSEARLMMVYNYYRRLGNAN